MKLDFLFQLQSPRFGQYMTWMLLGFALLLAFSPVQYISGERSLDPATVISLVPTDWLVSLQFYVLIRWTLIVSAVAWMFGKYTPWSCWMTCISFTVLWSLRIENATSAAQIYNITNMLLYIHAMWFQFYDKPIKDSIQQNRFWETPLYPRWVFLLCVFYIGLFHSLAGWSKIYTSGFDWPNGLSLQLWVSLFGWEHSPVGRWILSSRTSASFMQMIVLAVEAISVLALFSCYLRWLIGLLLLAIYVGVLTTFVDYGYEYNALIVAMFFLPVEQWFNRKQEI